MNQEQQSVAGDITRGMQSFFGDASPDTVFSEPHAVGDSIIITAASWERAGGFGFGSGYGSEDGGDSGGGAGGGGGGASQGRPVAVIKIDDAGVEVRPVIDFTKIGVTVLLTLIAVWRALRS